MTTLAPHLSAFFQERLILERQASANTCDSYAYAFKLLLNYASKHLKVAPSRLALEQIDAQLVTGFLSDLEVSRANAASSRNVRLAAIKSFMRFLEYRVPSALEQIQGVLAIPMKKTETRLVRHLTTEEIQALLDALDPSTGRVSVIGQCCTCASPPACVCLNLPVFGSKTYRYNLTPVFSYVGKDAGNVLCRCGSRRSGRCVRGWPSVEHLRFQSCSSTPGASL